MCLHLIGTQNPNFRILTLQILSKDKGKLSKRKSHREAFKISKKKVCGTSEVNAVKNEVDIVTSTVQYRLCLPCTR